MDDDSSMPPSLRGLPVEVQKAGLLHAFTVLETWGCALAAELTERYPQALELVHDVELITTQQDAVTRLMDKLEGLNMTRRAVLDNVAPASAAASGQVLRTTRRLTIGDRVYARGVAVPTDVLGPAAQQRLLGVGALVWSQPSPDDAGRAQPRILPPPEQARPNPSAEVIEEAVKDAVASFLDPVQAYRAAADALKAQMDPRDHYKVPDLLLLTQNGTSLSNAAHRSASERLSRQHNLVGRRPHVTL
jgi:hypothetical protein